MTDDQRSKLDDLASQVAVSAMLRYVISDLIRFRSRIGFPRRAAETKMISSLGMPLLPTNQGEAYVRRAASQSISRMMASIPMQSD